jgi:nitrogen fixation/metabolism regulation signal transduction histidine kinase
VPVTISLAEGCPQILGDAQQLRQVIHNLLQNAQDATLARLHTGEQAHKAEVSISTKYNSDSRRVRMTVRDSGTGFAPHILQRAFEPYVTTKVRGTGLGLAVVKKIADEHGARIDLSNIYADSVSPDAPAAEMLGDNTERKVLGAQVKLSFAVV